VEIIEDAFGFSQGTSWFAYLRTLRDADRLTHTEFHKHIEYIAEHDLPDTLEDFELLRHLGQHDTARQDIRANQVLAGIRLGRPVRLPALGIAFILCVPTEPDAPFYAAETLLSQAQWNRVLDEASGTGDAMLARTGLSYADAESLTVKANRALREEGFDDLEMAIPTEAQWALLAAETERSTVPAALSEPRLATAAATASGLRDVLGVAYQFCGDKIARGGHYSDRRRDLANAEEDANDTAHPNPFCGFRPVLLIPQP
jgi:hypothetical protein